MKYNNKLKELFQNPEDYKTNMSKDEIANLKKVLEIVDKVEALMKSKDIVTVAIDGNSGSGKSTFANFLNPIFESNLFHMDDFFLRPEQKTEERLKEIGGNVDYERFQSEVICNIKNNTEFNYQKYNCKIMKLDEFVQVIPKTLNIVEGSYSLHPKLIDNYDFKIFLEIDFQTQVKRIGERNGEFMLNKFIDEWIPKENAYFDTMKIKEKCDVIFMLP